MVMLVIARRAVIKSFANIENIIQVVSCRQHIDVRYDEIVITFERRAMSPLLALKVRCLRRHWISLARIRAAICAFKSSPNPNNRRTAISNALTALSCVSIKGKQYRITNQVIRAIFLRLIGKGDESLMDSADRDLRWGVTKRLEFIDFRLFWDGSFNRKDLVDFFGISEQQASSDIALYQARADRNLKYDRSQKTFVRSDGFEPEFIGPFSDRYLLQLMAVQNGWMSSSDTWFSKAPPVDVVGFIKRRSTSPGILIQILDAIKLNAELEIEYASLTGSPAGKRTIAPHSFLFAAGRWYVRAWSKEHNDFRDYSINRIAIAFLLGPSDVGADHDLEWHHTMELILVPNPTLDKLKQAAVAAEYDMVADELRVPSRLSAAFYIINEHNLDVEPGALKPEKQQLVLKNLDEVVQTREVVRRLSVEALRKNNGARARA
jgi:hypothetical protein